MKKIPVSKEKRPPLGWPGLTRRRFFRSAAGTGAGLVLGSKVGPTWAEEREEAAHRFCPVVPRPIPHGTGPANLHFFFPGPVEGAPSSDPNFPNAGHDPSLITDFRGVIAVADMTFSGTGTDLNTGASAPYDFECDIRFMRGVFVGLDNQQHRGTIGFI